MARIRSTNRSGGAGGSKARLALSFGTSALAVVRALKRVRHTRGTTDKLTTADAVAGLLPLITSAAIVLRQLRRKPETAQ
ncbi:hypothetical protein [uncultured Streptomyces sp.]|uniref:hypothetical protein n=1 Tax=uncultured Streptomyces sp. TaxID=174707 RepID=UPI00260FDE41|nr:hypothetical protein [uncultured Streptomyces sp.]